MTDFNKILDKARELEAKMKESQENIKKSLLINIYLIILRSWIAQQ